MTLSRKLGILILFGIPAIVGGGVVYGVFRGYPAVAVYEVLLYITAAAIVRK